MKELYKELITILNSLPGITTSSNNLDKSFDTLESSGWVGYVIYFESDEKEPEGLFFLLRSINMRYWEYGHRWRCEADISDAFNSNGDRPIIYHLFRPIAEGETEIEFDNEINSLIDNMHYHFHHDGFMTGYKMNREKYDLKEWKREIKLNDLGL